METMLKRDLNGNVVIVLVTYLKLRNRNKRV